MSRLPPRTGGWPLVVLLLATWALNSTRWRREYLCNALDDVDAAVSVDDARHFPNLQLETGILEGLLHLASAEESQIAPLLRAAAIRLSRQLLEGSRTSHDRIAHLLNLCRCLFFGDSNILDAPTTGPP